MTRTRIPDAGSELKALTSVRAPPLSSCWSLDEPVAVVNRDDDYVYWCLSRFLLFLDVFICFWYFLVLLLLSLLFHPLCYYHFLSQDFFGTGGCWATTPSAAATELERQSCAGIFHDCPGSVIRTFYCGFWILWGVWLSQKVARTCSKPKGRHLQIFHWTSETRNHNWNILEPGFPNFPPFFVYVNLCWC